MPIIDAGNMSDADLAEYDAMMLECTPVIKSFAPLAVSVWQDVLKELDRRGKVKLVSGSYDDIGNALVTRIGAGQ